MKRQFSYVKIFTMNTIVKKTFCILLIILLMCQGCSQEKNVPASSDDSWDEVDEDYLGRLSEQNQASERSKENVKRVGVAMPTRTSERWINDGMNIKAKLETLGYEVDLQYAGDDIDLQVSQIESMIRDGVNCLVIASIDSTKLVDVLYKARQKGIAVIAYDRLLMDTNAVSYYASFDNKMVGNLIGSYIVEKKELDKASLQGKSYTIEFFMGSPDDNNARFLYNGLMEELSPYLKDGTLVCRSGNIDFEDTCILRWSQDTAYEICSGYLTEFYPGGDLDIACSAFDGFAYGILRAWEKKGLSSDTLPLITGQDAEKPAIRNIARGRQEMTIYKDTRVLASKCVTMVQALLEGGEPEINDTKQYNNNVLVVPSYLCKPLVINADNYEEVLIGGGYYTREQLFSEE